MIKEWVGLQPGQEVEFITPPIEKVQLVKYAGASGDFNLIHTDEATARKAKLPGVIVHGMISMGILGDFVGQIVGNQGFVSQLQVRFIGMVRPGESLTCRAKVTAKDEAKNEIYLNIAAETAPGNLVTVGTATITYNR